MALSDYPEKKQLRLHLFLAFSAFILVVAGLFAFSAKFFSHPLDRIELTGKSRPFFVGTTYVHPTLLFALPLPDSTWQVSDNSLSTRPVVEDTTLRFMENIQPVARFTRTEKGLPAAMIEIGVVYVRQERSAVALTEHFLQDLRARTADLGGAFELLAPVTPAGNETMPAAWFVVRFDDTMPMNIWTVTLVTRGAEVFVLLLQAETAVYNSLIPDFTRLIEGFRFLTP